MRFRGQGMRRRSSFGSRGQRPARQWLPLAGSAISSATGTTSVSLYGLQAPTVTIGTDLTSDPPEDVTIMRVVADIQVVMTTVSAGARWILGLLVQDRTWTPGATFAVDADKRFLWTMTYNYPANSTNTPGLTAWTYWPPGLIQVSATADQFFECPREAVHIDIAPKVRLEDGKALHMVAYEEAGATSFTCTIQSMRLLMQRSRRR